MTYSPYHGEHSHDHHDDGHYAHGAAEEGHGHSHAAAEEVSLTGGLQEQRYSRAKERVTLNQAGLAEARANQRWVQLSCA